MRYLTHLLYQFTKGKKTLPKIMKKNLGKAIIVIIQIIQIQEGENSILLQIMKTWPLPIEKVHAVKNS